MPHLTLDFLGTPARLSAEPGPALDELRRDFAGFPASAEAPRAEVALCERSCPAPPGPWLPGWRGLRWRPSAAGRLVRFADGAWAEHDHAGRRVTVHAVEPERARELGFLALLSRAGEELDARGLHRVHALGFAAGGRAGVLLLPSGGGKSSIALELMRGGRTSVLSEESPVVCAEGLVRPFPLRLALRPGADVAGLPPAALRPFRRLGYGEKLLVDAGEAERLPPAAPARWLLIGRRSRGRPRVAEASRAAALAALGAPLVIGAGLVQMAEYVLRVDSALPLAALSRLRAAAALARRAEPLSFFLGSEGPAAAARELERLAAS